MNFILDIPKREDEDEEEEEQDEQEENDSKVENISDEGIEDSDSESETSPQDYLISSVSKTDLDLMSMLFIFKIRNLIFFLN